MKNWLFFVFVIFVFLYLTGCGVPSTPQTPPAVSTIPPSATRQLQTGTPTATASKTPLPPTNTTTPTATLIPPTMIALPTAGITQPANYTVCASGCDFKTIQAVLDDPSTTSGAIIEIRDPVHTEAGIVIAKDVTIRGLGAEVTIIQAHETLEDAPERVFFIEEGANTVIENVTIRHGKPSKADGHGGGIQNDGTLTLKGCVVTNNLADGGGGIVNYGALTLVDSTVSNNTAEGIAKPPAIHCGAGGGIKCGAGTLKLINSTISGNQAGTRDRGWGGGVHVGCGCTATFINSTISGNKSVGDSGGVRVRGTLQLFNCTIAKNIAKGEGGGVLVLGLLDYTNTIIADNSGKGGNCLVTSSEGKNFSGLGSIGANSFNLVEGGGCEAGRSADPRLGPLADNGGVVQTHALLPDSQAIDAIPSSHVNLNSDQRGLPRPVMCHSSDYPGDIGALEAQADECESSSPTFNTLPFSTQITGG